MVKTKSLKGSINFRKTLKKGNFVNEKIITMYFMLTKEKDINHIGVCLSKRNGNSVVRNKLKRWVKEIYKEFEIATNTGYNIIFMFKKDVIGKEVDFSVLRSQMQKLLREIKIKDERKNNKDI